MTTNHIINWTSITDLYWGSCYSIFSFISMFCRSLFVLWVFFFWHCVVCPSIYVFWLYLRYLQTHFIITLIWMTTHQIINYSIVIRILITVITYTVTVGIFLSTIRFISTIVLKVHYTSIIYYKNTNKNVSVTTFIFWRLESQIIWKHWS